MDLEAAKRKHRDELYEQRIASRSVICSYCSLHATTKVYTSYGNIFACSPCAGEIAAKWRRCFVCKEKAVLPRNEVEKGVYLCDYCLKDKVSPSNFERIYLETVRDVESILHGSISCKAELIPCSFGEMQEQLKDKSATELGLYTCETFHVTDGESERLEEHCSIRFVKILPEDLMRDTLAHEIAHHWLHHNVSAGRTSTQEEGFCEWVAYSVCKKRDLQNVVGGHLDNEDPVYGLGFREIKRKMESGKYWSVSSLFSAPTRQSTTCPKCGGSMTLQTSPQNGRKFWGCKRYPQCKGFFWADKN